MAGLFAVDEATELLKRFVLFFNSQTTASGQDAARLRRVTGDLHARAEATIRSANLAADLEELFGAALDSGVPLEGFQALRKQAAAASYTAEEGEAVAVGVVRFCLIAEAQIVQAMDFRSRDDVQAMMKTVNEAFDPAMDFAADNQEPEVFQALKALHAAVIRDLIERGRKLSQIVPYQFGKRLPSLYLSQRLYGDAGRADELKDENKAVHPAFMPGNGRALAQ
jgi:hypothetical protein